MPFSLTPKAINLLFELTIPRSTLEIPQEMAIYVIASTDSQTFPSTIVGHSKSITQLLLQMINSGFGYSQTELVRIEFTGVNDQIEHSLPVSHEARTLCQQFTQTVCTLELLCKPSDQMLKFVREQMGLPADDEALNKLQSESDAVLDQQRGTYDFFNDRDRWQFLSKELS